MGSTAVGPTAVGSTAVVTGGRGADVVFDPGGEETCERSTKCAAFAGRIIGRVAYGATARARHTRKCQ